MENEDLKVDGGHAHETSLSKLTGLKIKDVAGYISTEFDMPNFKLTRIYFDNGQHCDVEGEHDMPYIPMPVDLPGMDEERLQALYDADNA
jgi:hypothetical protein